MAVCDPDGFGERAEVGERAAVDVLWQGWLRVTRAS
jgi:hypothetical protein